MLVLTRKVRQSIVIAGDIRITIVKIQGDQVKIGIKAPSNMLILRSELEVPVEQQPISSAALAQTHQHCEG